MPLQNSDNLIIGRGDASYKITYQNFVSELPTGGGGDELTLDQLDARYVLRDFTTYPELP